MEYVQSVEPAEVAALAEVWGNAARKHVTLEVDHPFLTGDHQLLASNGRRAEICYVMHRGDPAAGLLLHTKRIYPDDIYRLPTGGIHEGELVIDTLAREIREETGLVVGDGDDSGDDSGDDYVQVQRYLGLLAYDLPHRSTGRTFTFATYHFLVQMPANGELDPQDLTEQIAGWQWCSPSELYEVAARLEDVNHIDPVWGDWGRFRALSHRFVADAIKN